LSLIEKFEKKDQGANPMNEGCKTITGNSPEKEQSRLSRKKTSVQTKPSKIGYV
jgi:hypothetical protein